MQPLYFAYGSNTLMKRLVNRVGEIHKVRTITIPHFVLDFNDMGYCFMRVKENEEVEGVLYQLSSRQIGILDYYEGYPKIYQKEYDIIKGFGLYYYYNMPAPKDTRAPSLMYLNTVIDGLIENKLFKTANKLIEYKNKAFKLPKGSRHKIMDII